MTTVTNNTTTVLEQLRLDATQSSDDIAEVTDISKDLVEEAFDQIQERGLIESYSAVVDPTAVGFSESSYHFVGSIDNYDETLERGVPSFNQWLGSQSAMVAFGEFDMIFRKLSRTEEDLDNFAKNMIANPNSPTLRKSSTYRINERYRWNGINVPEDNRYSTNEGLTDIEKEVAKILQSDGRLRHQLGKIASKLGSKSDKVAKAIENLEDKRIINGYTISPNIQELGWYRGFLGLSNLQNPYDEAVGNLLDLDPLYAPYIISGTGVTWADIGIEFVCRSVEHLDKLTDNIRAGPDARESRTLLSPKSFQNSSQVIIDME